MTDVDRTATQAEELEGRPMPAGKVLMVVVIALSLAALLNADALVKTAQDQPFGTRRSLAVDAAQSVRWVSRALQLDRPREAFETALGRHSDDDKGTVVVAAPAVPPASVPLSPGPVFGPELPTAPVAPQPSVPVPTTVAARPVLWAAGDSVAGKFAQSLVRMAGDTDRIDATLDFRLATGLTRPDVFDWPTHIPSETARLHATVVVLMFGGNDDQDMMVEGRRLGYASEAWRAEYGRRVGEIVDRVQAAGACVYWVGLPVMRSEELSEHAAMVNEIHQQQVTARPNAVYIDSWSLFTDGGQYASRLEDDSGNLQQVREADGVHLTRQGGDRLAAAVLPRVEAGCGR